MVKGIAEYFHAAEAGAVTSPTFTLIQEYRGPEVMLYHIDLYRIDTQRELDTLALDDLMEPNTILLIEWGEKFARFAKERDVEIAIEHLGGDETADKDREIGRSGDRVIGQVVVMSGERSLLASRKSVMWRLRLNIWAGKNGISLLPRIPRINQSKSFVGCSASTS